MEALKHPSVAALSIATRPDCFSPEIYELLEECNQQKPVWIELGLQTIHPATAAYIRRGYSLSVFEDTLQELQKRHIDVITHVILGLPGESKKEILSTIHYLNEHRIQGIKMHLLHVLKETDLENELDQLTMYTQEEYIDVLLSCIAHLSPEIVIHRLTGDGPKDLLLAPLWSRNKRGVLNEISHQLKLQKIYQGCAWTDYCNIPK